MDDAERLLAEYNRLRAILSATHISVPALLVARIEARASVGATEIDGKLDRDKARSHLTDIESELTSAVRGRAGSISALVDMEGELSRALSDVEQERDRYAAGVVSEFETRYERALQAFLSLHEEGVRLAQALRVPVPLRSPVKVTGAATAHFLASETTKVTVLPPDDTGQPVTADGTAEKIGKRLDDLSSALAYSRGLIAAKARPVHSVSSNLPYSPDGLFKVLREFRDGIDGQIYSPGTLVDNSLIDARGLARLVAVRQIVLVDGGSSGATC